MGWHTRQQERDFNSYFSMPFKKMGGLNIHYNNDTRDGIFEGKSTM